MYYWITDVFDILRNIPGIAVQGGVRTSGKTISIRGFSDNEDVLIQIDGVSQNFEKYRYGSGVDIDPELLKEIAVFRGGSSIAQASGYLGGVVQMETKDASDFLSESEQFGSDFKSGYNTNNDGKVYALTSYGRAFDHFDFLASATKRNTNDYQLPDGSRFPDSDESQLSLLGKMEIDWGDLHFTGSHRYGEDSGREPFDITGGVTGIGGVVRRDTKENATSLRLQYEPLTSLIDMDTSVGYIEKTVLDGREESAGGGIDTFDYRIWTISTSNKSVFEYFGLTHEIRYGYQWNRERRTTFRENAVFSGFNLAQPSGEKRNWGVYIDNTVSIAGFEFHAGARHDNYDVYAKDDIRSILEARGDADLISFSETTPSLGVEYHWNWLDIFYSYSEGFRAPLLDEYFALSSLSRCFYFDEFDRRPEPLPVPEVVFPDLIEYLSSGRTFDEWAADQEAATELDRNIEGIIARQNEANLQAWIASPTGQLSASCGDNYEPEQAANHEVGFAITFDGLISDSDKFFGKFTYYDTRVTNLIESIYQDAVTLEVDQPGVEVRKGYEIELQYDHPYVFAELAVSILTGYVQYNYFDNNIDPRVSQIATASDRGKFELINVPANTINFTFGGRVPDWRFEFGHILRAYDSRNVSVGTIVGCDGGLFVVPTCLLRGEQNGYMTSNLFASWFPHNALELRLTVDNLLNKEFQLSGFGGGLGAIAPGRDVRLSFRVQY
ncbi:MAG: TonB-dependent receptor [Pseudomonadota bacterium]